MYINKEYRVRFKRIVWVDTIVSAFDEIDAEGKAIEQADKDDYDHGTIEDLDFDVQETGEHPYVAKDGSY